MNTIPVPQTSPQTIQAWQALQCLLTPLGRAALDRALGDLRVEVGLNAEQQALRCIINGVIPDRFYPHEVRQAYSRLTSSTLDTLSAPERGRVI